MRSTEWVLVVALLFLGVCFQAARSQDAADSRTDPASTVTPGSGVTIASQNAFPSLDTVDSSRYQREDPEGSLAFEEDSWIDSIRLTIFFPRGSSERVSVEGDGFSESFEPGAFDDARLRMCPSPTTTITEECAIDDDWMLVVETVQLGDVCTKAWKLTLGGATCPLMQSALYEVCHGQCALTADHCKQVTPQPQAQSRLARSQSS